MRVEIVRDGRLPDRAAVWMAERIWEALAERGVAHVAVSGGTTPTATFSALVRFDLPWSSVNIWQVDERVAPDGDPDRNLTDLQSALLSAVPAVPHLMDVTATDLEAAAAAYADELHTECDGVLDIVHLGLGPDGHTASWPPGDPVGLVHDRDVAISGEYKGRVRMTMTAPCVNRARQIMFLVSGTSKVDAERLLLTDDPSIPASHVRTDDVDLLTDDAAHPGG